MLIDAEETLKAIAEVETRAADLATSVGDLADINHGMAVLDVLQFAQEQCSYARAHLNLANDAAKAAVFQAKGAETFAAFVRKASAEDTIAVTAVTRAAQQVAIARQLMTQ